LGETMRRRRGICQGCWNLADLVRGYQLCLICFVRFARQ